MKQTRLALGLFIALPYPAAAQEVIGGAEVQGREAVIYSDGTWSYAAEGGPVCHRVEPLLSVCVEPDIWSVAPVRDDRPVDLAFRHGTIFDAKISVWKTAKPYSEMSERERAKALIFGIAPRLTPEEFERSLQEEFRDNRGLLPTLAGRFDAEISMKPAKTLVFSGSPFGTRVISFRFADDLSIIVETIESSTLFTDEHKHLHARLLAGIALGSEL
ncbi:MAG: hypothetical protein J0L76_17405 [Rhodobacterales bacterium]|nr:hypothetical protein [Rhodobacterales bacterium]